MKPFLAYLVVTLITSCWFTFLFIIESPDNLLLADPQECHVERPFLNKIFYLITLVLSTWAGVAMYRMQQYVKEFEKKQQLFGVSMVEMRAQKLQMQQITRNLRELVESKALLRKSSPRKSPKFRLASWFSSSAPKPSPHVPPPDDGIVVLYKKPEPTLDKPPTMTSAVVVQVALTQLKNFSTNFGKLIKLIGKFLTLLFIVESAIGETVPSPPTTSRSQPIKIKVNDALHHQCQVIGDHLATEQEVLAFDTQQVSNMKMGLPLNFPREKFYATQYQSHKSGACLLCVNTPVLHRMKLSKFYSINLAAI